jgi:hypothetical protein
MLRVRYTYAVTVDIIRRICSLQFEHENTIMPNVEVQSKDVEGGEAKKTHGTFLSDNLPTAHTAFPFDAVYCSIPDFFLGVIHCHSPVDDKVIKGNAGVDIDADVCHHVW